MAVILTYRDTLFERFGVQGVLSLRELRVKRKNRFKLIVHF